jgi:hypothetical protein
VFTVNVPATVPKLAIRVQHLNMYVGKAACM